MSKEKLLEVENLKPWFDTPEGVVHAVDGIDFGLSWAVLPGGEARAGR